MAIFSGERRRQGRKVFWGHEPGAEATSLHVTWNVFMEPAKGSPLVQTCLTGGRGRLKKSTNCADFQRQQLASGSPLLTHADRMLARHPFLSPQPSFGNAARLDFPHKVRLCIRQVSPTSHPATQPEEGEAIHTIAEVAVLGDGGGGNSFTLLPQNTLSHTVVDYEAWLAGKREEGEAWALALAAASEGQQPAYELSLQCRFDQEEAAPTAAGETWAQFLLSTITMVSNADEKVRG